MIQQVFGSLRKLNRDVQDLRRSLDVVEEALAANDPQKIQAAVVSEGDDFKRNVQDIDNRLAEAEAAAAGDAYANDMAGEAITKIDDHWERAKAEIPPARDFAAVDANALKRHIGEARTDLSVVAREIGYLTIPARLNQWLGTQRATGRVSFHKVFEDELPDKDDREAIIEYIRQQPASFQGIVQPGSGYIYRVSDSRRRLLGIGLIVGAAALGFLIQVGISFLARGGGLGEIAEMRNVGNALTTYLLVLLGAGGHFLIDVIKSRKSIQESDLTTEDYLLWVHIRELSILLAILPLWFGPVALAWLLDSSSWLTAILFGYSVDSLADVVLTRFDKVMKTGTEALSKSLTA